MRYDGDMTHSSWDAALHQVPGQSKNRRNVSDQDHAKGHLVAGRLQHVTGDEGGVRCEQDEDGES